MSTRRTSRQAARRRPRRAQPKTLQSLYRRPLRYEPLEDRHLLALVTVTTPLDTVDFDDGLTSLREAIFATNLISGPDEITFDFGHNGPETIVLTQGELKITDDLTITGPGAELLTIDASGSDPTPDDNNSDGTSVFVINDGDTSSQLRVQFSGLSITGSDSDGAIKAFENLALDGLTIHDNWSRTGGGAIGATLFGDASLEFRDCSFSGNTARRGGGGNTRPYRQ